MAKKEFMYCGKTLDELQKISIEEFAKYVDSRKRRTLLRGNTDEQKRFFAKLNKKKDNIKTHCRDIVIVPLMVGKTIFVHKGKEYQQLLIQPEMIGHCLGEFAFTRKRILHSSPGVGATKSSSNVSVK
ncbi:MAG: 30S ribosomal protein S19 [Candidatus Woesearchaeota archaeon]